MKRRQFIKGSALATGTFLAMPSILRAQTSAEFSFFFPVAVGGPITKLIDKLAQDFEAETPGIKVKPIYAGTYQETIVKALTTHKAGTPPATSVLLSTDMFTLIDEGAVVPIDEFIKRVIARFWASWKAPRRTGRAGRRS
jgi:sn-glycerol 3-phosphate transport system substrate-binding protein